MIPGKYNFTIIQGATWERTIYITGLDLTDVILLMQIRKQPGETLLAEVSIVVSVTDTSNAVLQLSLDAEVTSLLDFVTAKHDLKLTFTDKVIRLFQGDVILSKEITI